MCYVDMDESSFSFSPSLCPFTYTIPINAKQQYSTIDVFDDKTCSLCDKKTLYRRYYYILTIQGEVEKVFSM